MMSLARIHAPNLETSENKSHRNKFACQRTFQDVGNISAMTLCLIMT
jgi:hypothetical protein